MLPTQPREALPPVWELAGDRSAAEGQVAVGTPLDLIIAAPRSGLRAAGGSN
jgi:hypothetical protein